MHELESIADELDNLLPLFQNGGGFAGQFLPSPFKAHFDRLLAEARQEIDCKFGNPNNFSANLTYLPMRVTGSPSYSSAQEVIAKIRAASRAVARKERINPASQTFHRMYVDPTRISALEALQGRQWDFSRLIELCREINVAAANNCHMSTAMLLRTIVNHVPPVLGFRSFAEVVSNYGGPQNRSFKTNMMRLQHSLRSIADAHLHSAIRASEDLPTSVQVDFSADLDVLLGEIIRKMKLNAN
ncbi:hypothetical protein [Agrobacterium larrymoorei]|uniref:hypothetical protein n=1 Tax=Agrobacterium larrymoorei TaxID=160699 RepID=UPI0030C1C5B0